MIDSKTPGLYLHIPFCRSKCVYCDFYSIPSGADHAIEFMDAYIDALCTHLKRFAEKYADQISEYDNINTVYFGGGTPSFIGARRLLSIWESIRKYYYISPGAEITLEANPDSICRSPDLLYILHDAGFNRLSLGMQSASDRELKTLGRVHTFEQVRDAVQIARDSGFENISLDLIYGLPDQDFKSWRNNLHAAMSLNPEHISCYGLKLEPGTPLYHAQEQYQIPDDDQQAEFYLYAAREFQKNDYIQYEISNFARPGRESRHNWKYWNLDPYFGFGPGAHSDFNHIRYAWARDLNGYIQAVRDGREPPLSEYHIISSYERVRERIMLNLRTVSGLNPADFQQDFDGFRPFLDQCARAGYAYWHNGSISLTPRGFLLSNQIISRLWELLT